MKRIMILFAMFFYLFSIQTPTLAAGLTAAGDPSVYDTIQKGDVSPKDSVSKEKDSGTSPSIFSLFIKFIVSFAFVIFLLFVLLRFLSKRNRSIPSNGPIVPIGDHPLGNNRSVQLVLISGTIYVLGVGETVTLLRTITQGEEYQHLLESLENQEVEPSLNWTSHDTKKLWNSVFKKQLENLKQHRGGK
ncbi:hypothetical protein FAY30_11045 [Bacillus sp. S3]|uniref:flagellar biosynthetic protein FliO n=1 Tax=Bacillus sp. S3 TaxID=486398 RepID=UPI0011880CFD|nr:flagellar biosynthetic protein FliO [Bacillus sp. S3]QCJ42401.1 hypothetical protein FAY30_11045 [Bacillus sp. S3]